MTGCTFLDDLFHDLIQRLAHRRRQRLSDLRSPYLDSVHDDGRWKDIHCSGQLDRLRYPDGMAGARKDLSTDRAHRSIESIDAARSLPTARSIDQDHEGHTFHQFDKVNAYHPRLDQLGTVTDCVPKSTDSQKTDGIITSQVVAKADNPN
jgi:hypothetical protein